MTPIAHDMSDATVNTANSQQSPITPAITVLNSAPVVTIPTKTFSKATEKNELQLLATDVDSSEQGLSFLTKPVVLPGEPQLIPDSVSFSIVTTTNSANVPSELTALSTSTACTNANALIIPVNNLDTDFSVTQSTSVIQPVLLPSLSTSVPSLDILSSANVAYCSTAVIYPTSSLSTASLSTNSSLTCTTSMLPTVDGGALSHERNVSTISGHQLMPMTSSCEIPLIVSTSTNTSSLTPQNISQPLTVPNFSCQTPMVASITLGPHQSLPVVSCSQPLLIQLQPSGMPVFPDSIAPIREQNVPNLSKTHASYPQQTPSINPMPCVPVAAHLQSVDTNSSNNCILPIRSISTSNAYNSGVDSHHGPTVMSQLLPLSATAPATCLKVSVGSSVGGGLNVPLPGFINPVDMNVTRYQISASLPNPVVNDAPRSERFSSNNVGQTTSSHPPPISFLHAALMAPKNETTLAPNNQQKSAKTNAETPAIQTTAVHGQVTLTSSVNSQITSNNSVSSIGNIDNGISLDIGCPTSNNITIEELLSQTDAPKSVPGTCGSINATRPKDGPRGPSSSSDASHDLMRAPHDVPLLPQLSVDNSSTVNMKSMERNFPCTELNNQFHSSPSNVTRLAPPQNHFERTPITCEKLDFLSELTLAKITAAPSVSQTNSVLRIGLLSEEEQRLEARRLREAEEKYKEDKKKSSHQNILSPIDSRPPSQLHALLQDQTRNREFPTNPGMSTSLENFRSEIQQNLNERDQNTFCERKQLFVQQKIVQEDQSKKLLEDSKHRGNILLENAPACDGKALIDREPNSCKSAQDVCGRESQCPQGIDRKGREEIESSKRSEIFQKTPENRSVAEQYKTDRLRIESAKVDYPAMDLYRIPEISRPAQQFTRDGILNREKAGRELDGLPEPNKRDNFQVQSIARECSQKGIYFPVNNDAMNKLSDSVVEHSNLNPIDRAAREMGVAERKQVDQRGICQNFFNRPKSNFEHQSSFQHSMAEQRPPFHANRPWSTSPYQVPPLRSGLHPSLKLLHQQNTPQPPPIDRNTSFLGPAGFKQGHAFPPGRDLLVSQIRHPAPEGRFPLPTGFRPSTAEMSGGNVIRMGTQFLDINQHGISASYSRPVRMANTGNNHHIHHLLGEPRDPARGTVPNQPTIVSSSADMPPSVSRELFSRHLLANASSVIDSPVGWKDSSQYRKYISRNADSSSLIPDVSSVPVFPRNVGFDPKKNETPRAEMAQPANFNTVRSASSNLYAHPEHPSQKYSVNNSPDGNPQTSPLSLVMSTKQLAVPNCSYNRSTELLRSLKQTEFSVEASSNLNLYSDERSNPSRTHLPFMSYPASASVNTQPPPCPQGISPDITPVCCAPVQSSYASNRRQSVNDTYLIMEKINQECNFENKNRSTPNNLDDRSTANTSFSTSVPPNQVGTPASEKSTVIIPCPPSSSWLQFSAPGKDLLNGGSTSLYNPGHQPANHNLHKPVSPEDSPINVVDDAPDPLFPNPEFNIPSLNPPLVSPKLKELSVLEGLGKKVASQLTFSKEQRETRTVAPVPGKALESDLALRLGPDGTFLESQGHPEESSRLRKFLKRYQRVSVDQPRSESHSSFCSDATPFQENFPFLKNLDDIANQERNDFSVESFEQAHLNLENESTRNNGVPSDSRSFTTLAERHIRSETAKLDSVHQADLDITEKDLTTTEGSVVESLAQCPRVRDVAQSDHFLINPPPLEISSTAPQSTFTETSESGMRFDRSISSIPVSIVDFNDGSGFGSQSSNCVSKVSYSANQVSDCIDTFASTQLVQANSHSANETIVDLPSENLIDAKSATMLSRGSVISEALSSSSTNNNLSAINSSDSPSSFSASILDPPIFQTETRIDHLTQTSESNTVKPVQDASCENAKSSKNSILGPLSAILLKDEALILNDDSDADSSCNLKMSRILGRRRHSTSSHSSKSPGCDSRALSPAVSQFSLSPKEGNETELDLHEKSKLIHLSDACPQNKEDKESHQLAQSNNDVCDGNNETDANETVPSGGSIITGTASTFQQLESNEKTQSYYSETFPVPLSEGYIDAGTINDNGPLKTIELSSIKETEVNVSPKSPHLPSADLQRSESISNEGPIAESASCAPTLNPSQPSSDVDTSSLLENVGIVNELKHTLKTPTKASIKEFPEDFPIISVEAKSANLVKSRNKSKKTNVKSRKPPKKKTYLVSDLPEQIAQRTTRSTRAAAKVSYTEFFDNEPPTPVCPPVLEHIEAGTITSNVRDHIRLMQNPSKKKRGRPKKIVSNQPPAPTSAKYLLEGPPLPTEIQIVTSSTNPTSALQLHEQSSNNFANSISSEPASKPADASFKLPLHKPLKLTIKRTLKGAEVKYTSTNDETILHSHGTKNAWQRDECESRILLPRNPRDPLGINDLSEFSSVVPTPENFDTDTENIPVADRLKNLKQRRSNKSLLKISRKLVKRSIRTPAHDPNYSYLTTPNATPLHFSSGYGSFTPVYTPLHRISYDGPGSTPLRIQGGDFKIHLVKKHKPRLTIGNNPNNSIKKIRKIRRSPKKKNQNALFVNEKSKSIEEGNLFTSSNRNFTVGEECPRPFSCVKGGRDQENDALVGGKTNTALETSSNLPSEKKFVSEGQANSLDENCNATHTSLAAGKDKIILKIRLPTKSPEIDKSIASVSFTERNNVSVQLVPPQELHPPKLPPLIIKMGRVQYTGSSITTEENQSDPCSISRGCEEVLNSENARIHETSAQEETIATPPTDDIRVPFQINSATAVQRKVSLPLKAELKNQRASLRQSAPLEENNVCIIDSSTVCDVNKKLAPLSQLTCNNNEAIPQREIPTLNARPLDSIEKELAAIVGDPYLTPRHEIQSTCCVSTSQKTTGTPDILHSQKKDTSSEMDNFELHLAAIDDSHVRTKDGLHRQKAKLVAILLDKTTEYANSQLPSCDHECRIQAQELRSFDVVNTTTSTSNAMVSGSRNSIPEAIVLPKNSDHMSVTENTTLNTLRQENEISQNALATPVADFKLHNDPKVVVQNLSSNEINSLQNRMQITPEMEHKKLPQSPPKLRNKNNVPQKDVPSEKEFSRATKRIFTDGEVESSRRSSCPGKIRKIMAERDRQRELGTHNEYEFREETEIVSVSGESSSDLSLQVRDIGLANSIRENMPDSNKTVKTNRTVSTSLASNSQILKTQSKKRKSDLPGPNSDVNSQASERQSNLDNSEKKSPRKRRRICSIKSDIKLKMKSKLPESNLDVLPVAKPLEGKSVFNSGGSVSVPPCDLEVCSAASINVDQDNISRSNRDDSLRTESGNVASTPANNCTSCSPSLGHQWAFQLGDSIDENATDYKDSLFNLSYMTPRPDCGENNFLPVSGSLGQTPNYRSSPGSPASAAAEAPMEDTSASERRLPRLQIHGRC
ncbi:uncharacterized protein LOC125179420 [Hyalella azteca]|uniref:Uncharacterized protein LOC125179420 n=1 Tax=Hyalella azteca TaxID=294128 RepID=A0A979FVC8_HYAAZ|nr:uncharacterized protein LOC125179420 [Hyalella azteca]